MNQGKGNRSYTHEKCETSFCYHTKTLSTFVRNAKNEVRSFTEVKNKTSNEYELLSLSVVPKLYYIPIKK